MKTWFYGLQFIKQNLKSQNSKPIGVQIDRNINFDDYVLHYINSYKNNYQY